MSEITLWVILSVSWFLGALVCLKLDSAITGNGTYEFDPIFKFTVMFFTWWVAAIYLLTCKHHVNNFGRDEWDY